MQLQEWVAAFSGWLGVTDPTAIAIATVGVAASLIWAALYLTVIAFIMLVRFVLDR